MVIERILGCRVLSQNIIFYRYNARNSISAFAAPQTSLQEVTNFLQALCLPFGVRVMEREENGRSRRKQERVREGKEGEKGVYESLTRAVVWQSRL